MNDSFESHIGQFIEKKCKNDGDGESKHNIQCADPQCIFECGPNIRITQKLLEILQPCKGGCKYGLDDLVIGKSHVKSTHGNIGKNDAPSHPTI